MSENPSQPSKEQIERAQRLHGKIEQLKSSVPETEEPGSKKSIKEEIAERVAELNQKDGNK